MTRDELVNIISKEGDVKEFTYMYFKCEVLRSSLLHLCGYIYIPKWHPLYKSFENEESLYNLNLSVHGGITYSEKDEKNLVIGFDCAHLGDLTPSLYINLNRTAINNNETYRDMEYVINETKNLAQQIHELYPKIEERLTNFYIKINKEL